MTEEQAAKKAELERKNKEAAKEQLLKISLLISRTQVRKETK